MFKILVNAVSRFVPSTKSELLNLSEKVFMPSFVADVRYTEYSFALAKEPVT